MKLSFTLALLLMLLPGAWAQTLVNSFETSADIADMQTSYASAALSTSYATQGTHSLEVTYQPGAYPKVYFQPSSPLDWSSAFGVAVDVTNPTDYPQLLGIRIDSSTNLSGSSTTTRYSQATLQPHQTSSFLLPLTHTLANNYGMQDLPYGTIQTLPVLASELAQPFSAAHVYGYQFYLQNLTAPVTLYFDNVRLLNAPNLNGIVDQYGQSTLSTWPGKVTQDSDIANQRAAEESALANPPTYSERDSYGGWAGGPTETATGWFYTKQINGKWWLVDPLGHLFFMTGMDTITEQLGNATFTQGRQYMFTWLPTSSDPLSDNAGYTNTSIYGPLTHGQDFDFYTCNLQRKYGQNYTPNWDTTAVERLKSWGFNTIGNSSDRAVRDNGVASSERVDVVGNFARIASGSDHGVQVPDAWDPQFPAGVASSMTPLTSLMKNDPSFIGYYVDDELSWEGDGALGRYGLGVNVLSYSSSTSYAKQQFLTQLQTKYGTIGALNSAWATSFASWSAMDAGFTVTLNAQNERDITHFNYTLARQYFQIVRSILKQQDPNHLYLGCRFSTNYYTPEILQACAQYADVVSFNIYQPTISAANFGFLSSLGKPIIDGEFHMGATDRGMFGPGLVAAPDQATRAQLFQGYVQSGLAMPMFVGVNWFRYVDLPTTAWSYNGEDWNIGFVNIADAPYPEMVNAAQTVNQTIYAYRSSH